MMIHDGLGITIGDSRHRVGCLGRFPVAPGIIRQVLGVCLLVALGVALVALGVALAALGVALDGFSWISLVFLGFPWIPGGRGGSRIPRSKHHAQRVVKMLHPGPHSYSQMAGSRIQDTAASIPDTGYRNRRM